MSTRNFIYTKTDISIPGSYPLTFTHFYNAIGSPVGVLGAGWTHSFDIQIMR